MYQRGEGTQVGVSGGRSYLSDIVDIDDCSLDSDSTGDENKERGNWAGNLEFVVSGLGYVVGLGNVWRFPYLVYRNGGGAFFIPYLIMLLFCGIPLVFMELSLGQYASLGPISVWKVIPLFKGVGVSLVIISSLVAVYYNMVVAWSFSYLFSSMSKTLPWGGCGNKWNTIWCNENVLIHQGCSDKWQNMTDILISNNLTENELGSGAATHDHLDPFCLNWTTGEFNNSLGVLHKEPFRYNMPSEEYLYLSTLNISEDIGVFGTLQRKLALCLLLAWCLIFVFMVKGIKSSGKVMYLIVGIPYLIILILLIQTMTMDGYLDGVKYYVTPKWHVLKEARVWSDAASQVFFSLGVCWGGLTTLASYNKFHNNIYRDTILICLGDTVMSLLAGFAVFSMIGILGKQLRTSVDKVMCSEVTLAFIAYPEVISRFSVPPLWSVLFFLMLSTMGLSTQVTTVETVLTAVIDENITLLKKNRLPMLLLLCSCLYLCGLPLTTQAGFYWLQLMDEYVASWSVMVLGLLLCVGLVFVYGLDKFCANIRHMIGETPSWWWKTMWAVICPAIIIFIFVFSLVDYVPPKFGSKEFPVWAQIIGFCFTSLPLLPVPVYMVYRLATESGSFMQRLKTSCQPHEEWGPALEKYWEIQYMPTVSALLYCPLHDLGYGSVKTVSERVNFTTVGIRTACSSESSIVTGSAIPKLASIHKGVIIHHAYSNPNCNASLYNASTEKLPVCGQNSCVDTDYILVPRRKTGVQMCDKSTQTVKYSNKSTEPPSLG